MFRSDRRFFLFTSAFVLLVAALPTLWAYHTAAPEFVFGGFLFNPIDGVTYLAKAYQGWEGNWLFTLPYSSQTSGGSVINFYYILIGHAARVTGISLTASIHIARLMGTGLLLTASWRYYGAVLSDREKRRTAFIISSLTLGMGWLLLPFGLIPADFWVAEAYPFLSGLTNAHFPLGLALILFLVTPRVAAEMKPRGFFLDAVTAFILGLVSPFGVLIAALPWAGLGLQHAILNLRSKTFRIREALSRPEAVRLAAVFAGGAPVILYYLYAIAADPVLTAWNDQNVTISPAWWDLLISFSPAAVLAVIGIRRAPRELVAWAVMGAVVILVPQPLQRRFLMGFYLPLAGLAAVGLRSLLPARRRFAQVVLLVCFLPGPILLFFSMGAGVASRNPLLFLRTGEAEALAWISAETGVDDLVLSSPEMGLFIPATTGRRVVYGHPFETIDAGIEKSGVEAFYAGADAAEQARYLSARAVDYVFFGPRENALGELEAAAMLSLVFDNGVVQIFRVER